MMIEKNISHRQLPSELLEAFDYWKKQRGEKARFLLVMKHLADQESSLPLKVV